MKNSDPVGNTCIEIKVEWRCKYNVKGTGKSLEKDHVRGQRGQYIF
jgi:hypothetical protein